MVTAFDLELNSPFEGLPYGITVRFFNSNLNYQMPHAYLSFLGSEVGPGPNYGAPGGAILSAIESETPFKVVIEIETGFSDPPLTDPLEISLGGFRYKLVK
jgi:hypothetical protein